MRYEFTGLEDLYPDCSASEIEEIQERLNQYVRLVWRMANDPEVQERLDRLTTKQTPSTLNSGSND